MIIIAAFQGLVNILNDFIKWLFRLAFYRPACYNGFVNFFLFCNKMVMSWS